MELRHYLKILRQRVWLIVITVLVTMGVAYVTTSRQPRYTAQATVYVGSQTLLVDPNSGELSGGNQVGLQRLAVTFAAMIDSRPVAQEALALTGIQRTAAAVVAQTAASPEPATNLIRVRVTDADPLVAQQLANGLARGFVEQVQIFEPSRVGADQTGSIPAASVFEEAALPTRPAPTGATNHLVVGALFGLALAIGAAVVLEYLDITIKDAEDAERKLGLPVLGVIPLAEPGLRPSPRGASLANPGETWPDLEQVRAEG